MSTETPARINKKTGGVSVAVERVSVMNAQVHSCCTSLPRPRHDALQSAVFELYK